MAKIRLSKEFRERYTLVRKIGEGGMGAVYLATHKELSRQVAVKFLRQGRFPAGEALKRMEREAWVCARLNHPCIVKLYDVNLHSPVPYMVFEYVDGTTLREYLDMHAEALSVAEVVRLFVKLCDALAYAHSNGIVHRDLKPENVLITAEGELKITDFGLAKCMGRKVTITAEGVIMGTPFYMSPEQIRGDELTPAVDVYAVGIMLYEALAGRVPFHSENGMAVLRAHLTRKPLSLKRAVKGVPVSLDRLVRKALEKEPSARWTSCAEMARALEEVGRELAGLSELSGADLQLSSLQDSSVFSSETPLQEDSRPSGMPRSSAAEIGVSTFRKFIGAEGGAWRRTVVVVAVCCFLLGGMGVWWLTRTPKLVVYSLKLGAAGNERMLVTCSSNRAVGPGEVVFRMRGKGSDESEADVLPQVLSEWDDDEAHHTIYRFDYPSNLRSFQTLVLEALHPDGTGEYSLPVSVRRPRGFPGGKMTSVERTATSSAFEVRIALAVPSRLERAEPAAGDVRVEKGKTFSMGPASVVTYVSELVWTIPFDELDDSLTLDIEGVTVDERRFSDSFKLSYELAAYFSSFSAGLFKINNFTVDIRAIKGNIGKKNISKVRDVLIEILSKSFDVNCYVNVLLIKYLFVKKDVFYKWKTMESILPFFMLRRAIVAINEVNWGKDIIWKYLVSDFCDDFCSFLICKEQHKYKRLSLMPEYKDNYIIILDERANVKTFLSSLNIFSFPVLAQQRILHKRFYMERTLPSSANEVILVLDLCWDNDVDVILYFLVGEGAEKPGAPHPGRPDRYFLVVVPPLPGVKSSKSMDLDREMDCFMDVFSFVVDDEVEKIRTELGEIYKNKHSEDELSPAESKRVDELLRRLAAKKIPLPPQVRELDTRVALRLPVKFLAGRKVVFKLGCFAIPGRETRGLMGFPAMVILRKAAIYYR